MRRDGAFFIVFVRRTLLGFFGLDGLVKRAEGAGRHTDDDNLPVDDELPLLKVHIPAATGSPQGVAARISADRTLSGDGAISGHVCYLPRNGFENISRFALHFNDEYRPLA